MKILGISHGKVRFNDLPKPQIIYPDDILVKIQYALLPPDDLGLYLGGNMIIPNPYMFGQAGSGIIEELGPAAYRKGLSEGDRVVWFYRANCGMSYQCTTGRPLYCPNMTYCTTSFAEYMTWKEAYIYKIPNSLPLEQGVFFQDVLDCLRVFHEAEIDADSSIAILGVNHKSLLIAWYAKLCGVRSVTVVSPNPRMLPYAKRFGADHVVRFGTDNLLMLSTEINEASGGFHAVIDCGGSLPLLREAMDVLMYGGSLVIPYVYRPGSKISVNLSDFYFKEPRIKVLKQGALDVPKALDLMPRLGLERLTENLVPFENALSLFSPKFYENRLCGIAQLPG